MEKKVTTSSSSSSVEDNEPIHINNTMQKLKKRGYSDEKLQLYYEVQTTSSISSNDTNMIIY